MARKAKEKEEDLFYLKEEGKHSQNKARRKPNEKRKQNEAKF
ncbi:MAG: hypothetical protein ACLU84_08520 [Clostridia bacterium]